MNMPPQVQRIVDELVQALNMQACRPSHMGIDFDDHGVAFKVTAERTFRRKRENERSHWDGQVGVTR